MIAPETWQQFGGLLAILIILGGAALALQRLGLIRPRNISAGKPGDSMVELRDELRDIRMSMAERYVRRDDYIPQVSLLLSKLDAQAAMLARLDERTKRWESPE